MKKIKFIERLVLDKAIQLVDPNNNISNSYSTKSNNSLKAASLLLKQNLLEESTTMIYYAMFHKTLSLFIKIGLKCENHAAAIILLKELFNINNDSITYAKKERIDKQYYTDIEITKDQVKDLLYSAEEFLADINLQTNTLNTNKIKQLRNNFTNTYITKHL